MCNDERGADFPAFEPFPSGIITACVKHTPFSLRYTLLSVTKNVVHEDIWDT